MKNKLKKLYILLFNINIKAFKIYLFINNKKIILKK